MRRSFDSTSRTRLISRWVNGLRADPAVFATSATLAIWSAFSFPPPLLFVHLRRAQLTFVLFSMQTINKDTYKSLDQPAYYGVHAIGEVWAEMLFEMAENLMVKHGFSSTLFPIDSTFYDDKYAPKKVPKAGNTLALQLIVDGLKGQPCRPSFINARDSILAVHPLLLLPSLSLTHSSQAENVLTNGDNACAIWRAFAKRGLVRLPFSPPSVRADRHT